MKNGRSNLGACPRPSGCQCNRSLFPSRTLFSCQGSPGLPCRRAVL
jgi:hypothetical protein